MCDETSPDASQAVLPPYASEPYFEAVTRMLSRIADALAHAHEQGIVHRDVKPGNVLLDRNGAPHVCDFGLAHDPDQPPLTRSSREAFGTLAYLSREQLQSGAGSPDPRSDVYAFGVMFHELLTLRRPYEGETSWEIVEQMNARPVAAPRVWNPAIPRELEFLCQRCLEHDPARRSLSMAELRDDLNRFADGDPLASRPPSKIERVTRFAIRHRSRIQAIAVVAVLMVVAVVATRHMHVAHEVQRGIARLLNDSRNLEALPATEAAAVRVSATALAARHPDNRAVGAATRSVLDQIDEIADATAQQARALLESGTPPPAGTPAKDYRTYTDAAFFDGLVMLEQARILVGDTEPEEGLPTLVDYLPKVSLEAPPNTTLLTEEVDWLYGDALRVERVVDWPRGPTPVSPGIYRFTVISSDGSFAELSRVLHQRGRTTSLRPTFRPTDDVTHDMVLIPAGPFPFGADSFERYFWWKTRHVDLPAFWIDEAEVTNAEFREFLAAHPDEHSAPWWWKDNDFPPELADHPVIGVGFFTAQAYAEWRGKRLPTWQEWEKAARGPEGRRFPWPGDQLPTRSLACMGYVGPPTESRLDTYRAGTKPVRSHPMDQSYYGVLDMLGNVREWTDTIFTTAFHGEPYPEYAMRVIKGMDWAAPLTATQNLLYPEEVSVNDSYVGFRCAKTATEHVQSRHIAALQQERNDR